ncbi:MAG: beta-N-acetylhexosaminidase [Oceanospirillaceae bacterium]|nr:beta-N-acetylhexosaminidase [Oceanospirillaceae bacterium]
MFYGRLMLDVSGYRLTASESEQLQSDQVGGLILFARNYQSRNQLTDLIGAIRQQNSRIVIAVDQEGGRVQRFKDEFVRLPAMFSLCKLYSTDVPAALHQATEMGWLMASELIEMDVDISFAPVLDIHWAHSTVIGDRSFGTSHAQVTDLCRCFIKGMRQAGMASTGKHFPGHGWASQDSHHEIARDDREFSVIEEADLQPFKQLIASGLDAVMPAHVVYSKVDPNPAGFSRYWLQEVLRKQCGFEGVVFSDDLNMSGAFVADSAGVGQYAARAMAAISAGCDTVLLCNNAEGASQVLEALDAAGVEKSTRLASMRHTLFNPDLQRFEHATEIANKLRECSH